MSRKFHKRILEGRAGTEPVDTGRREALATGFGLIVLIAEVLDKIRNMLDRTSIAVEVSDRIGREKNEIATKLEEELRTAGMDESTPEDKVEIEVFRRISPNAFNG